MRVQMTLLLGLLKKIETKKFTKNIILNMINVMIKQINIGVKRIKLKLLLNYIIRVINLIKSKK